MYYIKLFCIIVGNIYDLELDYSQLYHGQSDEVIFGGIIDLPTAFCQFLFTYRPTGFVCTMSQKFCFEIIFVVRCS